MAKSKQLKGKTRSTTKPRMPEIEIEPGAWERFEKLVKSAAKMGHQAQVPTKPKAKSKARKPAKQEG